MSNSMQSIGNNSTTIVAANNGGRGSSSKSRNDSFKLSKAGKLGS
jgi:hypothetical protein